MTLLELHATFLRRVDDARFAYVADLREADGVKFLCPVCFQKNEGPVGTHSVICWAPSVPQTTRPTPGRWEMLGTSLADLTLSAASSSVKLEGLCNAHFFVRNGKIE